MDAAQRIFISYRRSDCQSQANGLNDGLRNRLPNTDVFMDLDSIPPGADFEEYIRSSIEQCDVVLVMIGDEWLEPLPGTTSRRIDDPDDFVRLEVATALRSEQVRVIPVLVEGARMPPSTALPEDIARLARLNAFVLSDSHWGRDLQELTTHLGGSKEPASPDLTVTFADIDAHAVKYAISALPAHFATKDVSTHPAMLATHEDVASGSNYHTIVGRFLMQHRVELGLESPAPPKDDRGSRWTKAAAASAPSAPAQPFVAPEAASVQNSPAATGGKWMIALPIISFGLLAFLPPLMAAGRLKHDSTRQRRMYLIAAALGVLTLVAYTLVGSSPQDANGTATGPASSAGAFLVLACIVVSVVIAVKSRKPALR